MSLPVYIDIDGTLTDDGARPNGKPIVGRIEKVRQLLLDGQEVVLWSGNGTKYARAFAARHRLIGVTAIGKPAFCVDDVPTIRPVSKMPVLAPAAFFKA